MTTFRVDFCWDGVFALATDALDNPRPEESQIATLKRLRIEAATVWGKAFPRLDKLRADLYESLLANSRPDPIEYLYTCHPPL